MDTVILVVAQATQTKAFRICSLLQSTAFKKTMTYKYNTTYITFVCMNVPVLLVAIIKVSFGVAFFTRTVPLAWVSTRLFEIY